jgi:competence protein ComEA
MRLDWRALILAAAFMSFGAGAAGAAASLLPARPVQGVVHLNSATARELDLLPGIGPRTVKLILAYRERQRFRAVDDLRRVKGVGPATFRKVKPHLAVTGPTTIALARKDAAAQGGARLPASPPQAVAPPCR